MTDKTKLTHMKALEIANGGMIKQGQRSALMNGQCLYLSNIGHCAIGHILAGRVSDDSIFWGQVLPVTDILKNNTQVQSVLGHLSTSFLRSMQKAHDDCTNDNIDNWYKTIDFLRERAKALDLRQLKGRDCT